MSRRVATWQGNTIVPRDFTMGTSMRCTVDWEFSSSDHECIRTAIFEATGRFGPAKFHLWVCVTSLCKPRSAWSWFRCRTAWGAEVGKA